MLRFLGFLFASGFVIFCGLAVGAGYIIWQTQKEKIPALDAHGKMVTNFMISMTIYLFVSIILMIVIVGFLLLPILGIIGIVFPIIGGIKANNGEFWEYPLTIKFLK